MAPETQYDDLAADLVALGRGLPQPASGDRLTVAVMARLTDPVTAVGVGAPQRLLRRVVDAVARRRNRVAAVVTAILVAMLAAPPVRAAVADWFGFAGVIVRQEPGPGPSSAQAPPSVMSTMALADAKELVAFEPVVPAALGPPRGVEVSADRRLLSMSWTDAVDGTVRLDQFDGRLDYTFGKSTPGVEFTTVAGSFAMWFDRPHEVVVLDRDGTARTETARLAGHTLIWERGETALRLEGDLGLARAQEIAASVTAVR